MFRRGRHYEATTSALGVDEHPNWSYGQGEEPERAPVAPKATLLRYDSPPWLIEQELHKHHRARSHAASPLRGVSTQEVLAALVDAFSPVELDWELVGVAFVEASPDPTVPVEPPVELPAAAPWDVDVESAQPVPGLDVPSGHSGHLPGERGGSPSFISRRPARWGREHDQIVAAVRELAWELVGVAFVEASPDPTVPVEPPVELVAGTPWAVDLESSQPEPYLGVPSGPSAHLPGQRGGQITFTTRRPARWGREHDQIVAAVRELAWDGYFALVGDIFRREGYEVFGGEGPDGDVIDMEAVRGAERLLVNCQLRGLDQIGVDPLSEMFLVAQRNEAGVAIVSDGDFAPEAWTFADEQGIAIIDKEILTGLVLELTLGNALSTNLKKKARRLMSILQPASRKWGAAPTTH